jgi:hypothetical protein
MKYKIWLNTREWELTAEAFDFDKYLAGEYDNIPDDRQYLDREAWQGNVPLFLHYVGFFDHEYLIEKFEHRVTPEPIFSIFEMENLTFRQMIQEIWKRRKEIVKVTEGDGNPYEDF